LRMGAFEHQRVAVGLDMYSDLSDRAQNIRRECCGLVSVDLGATSVHLVLVDSLDLGHDVYTARAQLDFSGCAGVGRMAGSTWMDTLRVALGRGGVGQSVDARVFALLRILGLAETIPKRIAIHGRYCSVFTNFFRNTFAVDHSKSCRLRAVRLPA